MTLPTITIDNAVKYISSTNSSPSENAHDHKSGTVSNPKKQNEKFSQNNKKFIKDIITGEGFGILKWKMNCYFLKKYIQIR